MSKQIKVDLGSRKLRRAVEKLTAAIEEEIADLVAKGRTTEEAQQIVSLRLDILRKRN